MASPSEVKASGTAKRIDGTQIAKSVRERVAIEVKEIVAAAKVVPTLAVVLVGDRPDSQVYVSHKIKACDEVGMRSVAHRLPSSTTEVQLLDLIDSMNRDASIHGVLIQLPFGDGCQANADNVLARLDPNKDVDGLHAINTGRVMIAGALAMLVPCTPRGVIELLDASHFEIEGKHVAVIGRSNLVGKPVAQLFLGRNATVTQLHSKTKDIQSFIKLADIVVAAIGKPKWLKGAWLKPGAVVIDVGMNVDPDRPSEAGKPKKLCGDVDYDSCVNVASAITPVPGGVGPMTVAMLLSNTLRAYHLQNGVTPATILSNENARRKVAVTPSTPASPTMAATA